MGMTTKSWLSMALSAEEVVKGHLKGQELEQKIVEISAKAINDYKNSTKEYSKTYYKHQGREYSPDRDAARDEWNAFKSWAKKKLKALLSEKFPGFENNKEVGYAASFSKKEWVN